VADSPLIGKDPHRHTEKSIEAYHGRQVCSITPPFYFQRQAAVHCLIWMAGHRPASLFTGASR
jgi:hypothetical protein